MKNTYILAPALIAALLIAAAGAGAQISAPSERTHATPAMQAEFPELF